MRRVAGYASDRCYVRGSMQHIPQEAKGIVLFAFVEIAVRSTHLRCGMIFDFMPS